MARYDVFNGDADGICALLQLRLAAPADSTLITGVKRDIDLLKQVAAAPGDEITVLDVSMDTNRAALDAALAAGAKVTYVDHHFPGEIPQHGNLTAHINTDASCCTSLLVNEMLGGRFLPWAISCGPPTSNSMAAVAIRVFGHRVFTAMPYRLNSSAMPRLSMVMAYFVVV